MVFKNGTKKNSIVFVDKKYFFKFILGIYQIIIMEKIKNKN